MDLKKRSLQALVYSQPEVDSNMHAKPEFSNDNRPDGGLESAGKGKMDKVLSKTLQVCLRKTA